MLPTMRPRTQMPRLRAQHVALAGSERRDLVERLSQRAARPPVLGASAYSGRLSAKRLTSRPFGAVQLDRRRQPVRSRARCATRRRTPRSVAAPASSVELATSSASDGIASIWSSGLLQPLLQILALARRLRAELSSRSAAPWPRSRCATSDGYIARAGTSSARKNTASRAACETRRIRAARPRQRQRAPGRGDQRDAVGPSGTGRSARPRTRRDRRAGRRRRPPRAAATAMRAASRHSAPAR